MATIEVDFDVYKALTIRRATESTTYNEVVRELLGLDKPAALASTPAQAGGFSGCFFKGVCFPNGTEFRATYKGRLHRAKIQNGDWIDEAGKSRSSPSEAAHAITETNVNGWRFWECKRPGDTNWRPMDSLRSGQ